MRQRSFISFLPNHILAIAWCALIHSIQSWSSKPKEAVKDRLLSVKQLFLIHPLSQLFANDLNWPNTNFTNYNGSLSLDNTNCWLFVCFKQEDVNRKMLVINNHFGQSSTSSGQPPSSTQWPRRNGECGFGPNIYRTLFHTASSVLFARLIFPFHFLK